MEQRLSPSFTPWAKHVDDLSFAFFFFFWLIPSQHTCRSTDRDGR